jgi:DNA-binding transcriptional regulator YiaG
MPNIANVLKDEIKRLARRELNLAIAPLKVSNTALKKLVYEHKQRITALEKENKRLAVLQGKIHGPVHDNTTKLKEDGFSITGRQVRSLRGRLGISQAQLAKLLGVSDNIVSIWENKPGRLRLRKPGIRKALSDLKGMKRREVLEQVQQEKKGGLFQGERKNSKEF